MLVPVVLVNGFAVYGQAGWAQANIDNNRVVAYLFAAALESIAVYLAWEAHRSLMAGDAALKLRLASYLMAGMVGILNYSHWSPDWEPTAKAIVFALFSVVSPWLWSIRSRSMRRADLRAQGLIDPRSVRFSAARWTLYPVRTFRAFRRAVWLGLVDPSAAIQTLDQSGRAELVQSTTETVSVQVAVQSTDSGPDLCGDDQVRAAESIPGPDQADVESTGLGQSSKGVQSTPAVGARTTRRAIQSRRTVQRQASTRDDRTIEQLADEIRAAVESGMLSTDLPVEPTRKFLRVGKPKARTAIEAYQSAETEVLENGRLRDTMPGGGS